jgi:polysaccharide deacetylase family protein (PEP-CTERM system associated)
MNLLTFDIEDWYHINYPIIDFSLFDRQEDHQALFGHVQSLTEFCRINGIQGTFFVLARLLEKRPRIGEWIVEQGQELALHGYEHDLLTGKEPDQFKKELEHSLDIFRRITGRYPLGYRAPSWSINLTNLWVLETLEAFGFTYDASIFPIKNFLYGLPTAPAEPFYPVIGGRQLRMLEVPVSIARLGARRIAYSGGMYFNLWPFPVVRKLAARQTRRGGINLFYFHPWDLWKRSPDQCRRLKGARWVTIHLGDSLLKFKSLLSSFPLGNISAHLDRLKERAGRAPLGMVHESA